jgi:acylphosphatase
MPRQAWRLLVEGRVQGVGYRWWTMQRAQRLGLDGWVRNLADGSVEILAIGPDEAVGRLAEACRSGPSSAAVTSVERTPAADDGSQGFGERATA